MEIFDNEIGAIKHNPESVVTVGTFDGLHLGHRKLLERMVESELPSTVVTFFPHPQMVVARPGKAIKLLTTPEEKVAGMAEIGVDRLVVLKFNRELMNMTAEEFLRSIIIERIGLKKMVVGYDHSFGRDREGNKDFVVEQGRKYGFATDVIAPFYCDNRIVSSTLIRKTLDRGEVKLAAEYLGRLYSFSGWVIKGDCRGASLGFPTANLKLDYPHKMLPLNGVYAAKTKWLDRKIPSLLYIGNRPTYGAGGLTIEVYLMDFTGELYGERLTVELVERLRGDIHFSTEDELVEQMKRDEERGRDILLGD